jgi:hypothetical protein
VPKADSYSAAIVRPIAANVEKLPQPLKIATVESHHLFRTYTNWREAWTKSQWRPLESWSYRSLTGRGNRFGSLLRYCRCVRSTEWSAGARTRWLARRRLARGRNWLARSRMARGRSRLARRRMGLAPRQGMGRIRTRARIGSSHLALVVRLLRLQLSVLRLWLRLPIIRLRLRVPSLRLVWRLGRGQIRLSAFRRTPRLRIGSWCAAFLALKGGLASLEQLTLPQVAKASTRV